jgi:hypothetical protein
VSGAGFGNEIGLVGFAGFAEAGGEVDRRRHQPAAAAVDALVVGRGGLGLVAIIDAAVADADVDHRVEAAAGIERADVADQ